MEEIVTVAFVPGGRLRDFSCPLHVFIFLLFFCLSSLFLAKQLGCTLELTVLISHIWRCRIITEGFLDQNVWEESPYSLPLMPFVTTRGTYEALVHQLLLFSLQKFVALVARAPPVFICSLEIVKLLERIQGVSGGGGGGSGG